MCGGLRVAVLVPAHNEQALVGVTVGSRAAFVDHGIVVDVASSDDTAEVAKTAGDSRTRVILPVGDQGVGGAIVTRHAEGVLLDTDVLAVMAGDAQIGPDHPPAMLDPIASPEAQFTEGDRLDMSAVERRYELEDDVLIHLNILRVPAAAVGSTCSGPSLPSPSCSSAPWPSRHRPGYQRLGRGAYPRAGHGQRQLEVVALAKAEPPS